MRLATYNVENLFQRARAMNQESWAEGRDILKYHGELNAIFAQPTYAPADKKRILELVAELGLAKSDESKFVILRQNRGRLLKRPKTGALEVIANGRSEWLGWLDLQLEEVNEVGTRNTARAIHHVGPDVLAVVEADSRPGLVRFSDYVIPAVAGGKSYDHVMLIDGNDGRGIDVGLMARAGYSIDHMRSHVDDVDGEGRIFSRDCAEHQITTPSGSTFVLLINHFKSKGYGSPATSNRKRERQALGVKRIYQGLVQSGQAHVAVVGDLNDTPDSDPLAPLIQQTDLRDVSELAAFDDGGQGRPGTFGNGTKSNKIDYVLLSPALFAVAKQGGIDRMGVWGGVNGTLFPHFDEITKPSEAASDHAVVWVDLDL